MTEFDVVQEFTNQLGLKNQTDGTLFLYQKPADEQDTYVALKPDGYYFYQGVTFILDAKSSTQTFSGQLEDYMRLEPNKNFVGFKYNHNTFQCYVKGEQILTELKPQTAQYYLQTYFADLQPTNQDAVVAKCAKQLANAFRDAGVDKQYNVIFIGMILLCANHVQGDLDKLSTILKTSTTTATFLDKLKNLLQEIFVNGDENSILNKTLKEDTLRNASGTKIASIVETLINYHNYIQVCANNDRSYDVMNNFLKIFRKGNSVNANEKGEVFTPNHIASLMYDLVDGNENDVFLDPTCGSGTFLLQAMQHFKTHAKDWDTWVNTHIKGIEINDFNVTLTTLNLMLHNLKQVDCLYKGSCFNILGNVQNANNLQNSYNKVLMNPPFSVADNEGAFVLSALSELQPNGQLAVILPKSCLKQPLLHDILSFCTLKTVVSLPGNLFAPNADVKTCIVVLQKDLNTESHKILQDMKLIDMDDDGYVYNSTTSQRECKDYTKGNAIKDDVVRLAHDKNVQNVAGKCVTITLDTTLQTYPGLLFEDYDTNRTDTVSIDKFIMYIREHIAGLALCGLHSDFSTMSLKLNEELESNIEFASFALNDILQICGKGDSPSVDSKIENKFVSGLHKYPLIAARKTECGIKALVLNEIPVDKQKRSKTHYTVGKNKFVIISGGDGGGGKTYYLDFAFIGTSFALICDLQEKYQPLTIDKYAKMYLSIVVAEKLYTSVNYGHVLNAYKLPNIKISLPVDKNNEIAGNYMSKFIRSLKVYSDL